MKKSKKINLSIIAVICLIAVFVVGYARNKRDNDEDDY